MSKVKKAKDDLDGLPAFNEVPEEPAPHPTELTVIKQAPVDVEIIPVVNWLNAMQGVKTLFCCQGEETPKRLIETPHVLFTCDWDVDLVRILRTVTAWADNFSDKIMVTVDYFSERLPIRYEIRWKDRAHMKDFAHFLKLPMETIDEILQDKGHTIQERVRLNKLFGLQLGR